MAKLFRAISQAEKDDYDETKLFNTGRNTLEAKQFFKSLTAVKQFVASAAMQEYNPAYLYFLTVTVDDDTFNQANPTNIIIVLSLLKRRDYDSFSNIL